MQIRQWIICFLWFARTILKVKSSTSNLITLGECGILPPSVFCHVNVILYAIRLNSVIDDDILKCVFNQNVELHNIGYTTWYSKVLSLAKSYDINIENMVYSDSTKLLIKKRIRSSFIETWYKDINNLELHPLLRTYVLFKNEFSMSSHLICVKDPKFRNAINKIRCSSHLLGIERGRHTKPKTPIEQRLCIFCNVLDDEIHFICDCSLFTSIRNVFFSKIISKHPRFDIYNSKEKFIFVFSSDDCTLLTWLGQFIMDAFKIRDHELRNK